MDLFGAREAIPGIRFEERFPLIGLRSAPLQGVLARFVHSPTYRLDLTFGRPRRHFLAIWRGNQSVDSNRPCRCYDVRWWRPKQRTRQVR